MEKRWFKVCAYRGHLGAGKELTVPIFIFERDTISALNRCKTIPGIKKRISTSKVPDICEVTEEDVVALEDLIKREGKISLDRAKERWFLLQ